MDYKVIKILAVDDNNDNLVVLKALLKDGFPDAKFISAGSGNKGFDLCLAEKPDVILLDIVMPGMDGYEFCAKLKRDNRLKAIPVIMITAIRDSKESRIKALDAGADAFLSKPVEDSELKAQIRAMLRIKESEDTKLYQKQQLENMVLDRTEALEKELADRKRTERKLVLSLEKLNRNRRAMQNLMEDLKSEMSERKKMEENLQEERNLLRLLIDNIPDAIYFLDKDCKKVIANKADQEITGFSSEAGVLGKTDLELFPGKTGEHFHAINQSVIRSGRPVVDMEEKSIDNNGNIHWLQSSSYPFAGLNGQINGLLGIRHDITVHKRSEQELELKNSELHFINKIAIELAQLPLSEKIEEYLPKQLMRFSGAILAVHMAYDSEKHVLVTRHIETSHSIFKKILRVFGKNILETEFPVSPEQYRTIISEGVTSGDSAGELLFDGISDASGKTIKSITGMDHFFVIANIIGSELFGYTMLGFQAEDAAPRKELLISFSHVAAVSLQRRKAEAELINSEERYRMLINNQGEGVCIVDLDENFKFANPAAEKMFGVEPGTLIQYNLKEFLSEDQVQVVINETLKRSVSEKSTYEFEITRHDQEKRTLLVTATPQFDNHRIPTGSFGVFRDITDRRLAEEQLRESYIFNELLLRTIPFGMDIIDEEGNVLFQSETFKKLFGQSAHGKKCWELYRDDKTQCSDCPLNSGIDIGKTVVRESHGILGGKIFEIIHTGILFHGKKSVLEIFQDISDRKNAEINISRQFEELKRWHEATLDRESRILELKKEVNDLLSQRGLPVRYNSAIF